MRVAYQQELSELAAKLAALCASAELAIQLATQSLLEADLNLAEDVISSGQDIDALALECEHRAFAFLALQAPVARDLRTVVSGLQIIAGVQRMGGLALHIAETVRRRHPDHVLPDDVRSVFEAMGQIAVGLAAAARDVLITRDLDRARQLKIDDASMNQLHRDLFGLLMDAQWSYGVEAAVDVTLLGRFYERLADHSVDVARRVEFLITGEQAEDFGIEAGLADDF